MPPSAPSLKRSSSSSSGSNSGATMPSVLPLARGPSTGGSTRQYDWHLFLTIEERQAVRKKIKQAYTSSCKSYEDLLETVVAIEEELLHISTPSRLDYFKSGCQYDRRVVEKRKQLEGELALGGEEEEAAAAKKPKL